MENLQHLIYNGRKTFRQFIVGFWGKPDIAGDEPFGKVCRFSAPQIQMEPGFKPVNEKGSQLFLPRFSLVPGRLLS